MKSIGLIRLTSGMIFFSLFLLFFFKNIDVNYLNIIHHFNEIDNKNPNNQNIISLFLIPMILLYITIFLKFSIEHLILNNYKTNSLFCFYIVLTIFYFIFLFLFALIAFYFIYKFSFYLSFLLI